jgi:hypothetical protein
VTFAFLQEFRNLFDGKPYLHRVSTHGDYVSQFVFEDLYHLGHSPKLNARIDAYRSVLNAANKTRGVKHRRGDGSFGTLIPGEEAVVDVGFVVGRGPIANVELGIEVKILAKAMIKQIDRVKTDLINQVRQFRKSDTRAVTAAIVGVNHATLYRFFEGTREFVTDGSRYKHPSQEAATAIRHVEELRPEFDEVLILPYIATNLDAFPFTWRDQQATRQDYGAFLVRLARDYEQRF